MSKTLYLVSHGVVKSKNAVMQPIGVKGEPDVFIATPSDSYQYMETVKKWVDGQIEPKSQFRVNASQYFVSLTINECQKCTGKLFPVTDAGILNTGKSILGNPVYAFVGIDGSATREIRYSLSLAELIKFAKKIDNFDKIVLLCCRVVEGQTCIPNQPVTARDLPGEAIKITSLSKRNS